MAPKNLVPDQYQIEDLVMGPHTPYRVTEFEIMPYATQAGDYQVPREDETRFGFDQITPAPINLKIQVLDNRWLTHDPPPGATLFKGSVAKLAQIWRADDVRYNWGEMKPLYYCGKDGIVKEIYGRPGKFQYPRGHKKSDSYEVTAEFRRADTVSYSYKETYSQLTAGVPKYVFQQGDAQSWMRIFIEGPITNPVINIGEHQFKLSVSLAAGEYAEVSSYPWRRRAMDSNGVNLRAYMSGVDYLDRFKMYANRAISVRWTSDEVNTWVPVLGNQDWHTNIDDLNWKNLPDTFDILNGRPVVGFDLFNPDFAEKYLRAGTFSSSAACVYKDKKYNTAYQHMEAKVVQPYWGRSGLVIMATDTMSSGVVLEVQSGPGNNWLRIRNITSPTAYSTVRAQWQNTAFGGWRETDIVGIEYDPPTKTYKAIFNGTVVASWVDSGDIVPTGASNRASGFIFDMDGNLLSLGTGFKDIFCYDTKMTLTPIGNMYVVWKDAYQVIQ